MPNYSDFLRQLTSDPSDARAIDALESLDAATLSTVEVSVALAETRETLRGLGELETAERLLSLQVRSAVENAESVGSADKKRAIEAWRAVLRLDRDNERAPIELRTLLSAAGHFSGLIEFLKEQEAQVPRGDVARRLVLLAEMASTYRDHLKLDAMVIQTGKSMLELEPSNGFALGQLADRYRALSRWNDLYGVLVKLAENADLDDDQRRTLLVEAAELATDRLSNPARAIEPLKALLALAPDDRAMRDRLYGIYEKRRQWKELCELIEDSAKNAAPDGQAHILVEAARLATQKVSETDVALRLWQRVLDYVRDYPSAEVEKEALTQLGRLCERDKKYETLCDVYRRQVELEKEPGKAVELLEKLGAVCLEKLGQKERALDVFEEILSRAPNHGKALRIVRDVYTEKQDDVALELLYAERGQWEELVETLHAWSEKAEPSRKLYLLRRSAEVAATRLNNPERVARAYERILTVAPGDADAARALLPIYEGSKKWPRLTAMQELVLADPNLSQQARGELLRQMAHLQGSVLKNYAKQAELLQQLLDMEPRDQAALAALEQAALQRADWRALLDVYRRTASVTEDKKQLLELLQKSAQLEEERVKDTGAAIATYQRIIELDPDATRAHAALARMLQQRGDWSALAAALEAQLLRAEGKDRVQLCIQLGELCEHKLNAPERALEHYKAAFKSGSSKAICTALERFWADSFPLAIRADVARLLLPEFEDQGDNERIARALGILRLEATGDAAAELDRRLLTLLAAQKGGKPAAFQHGLSALALDPFHGPTRERLMSLARDLKTEAQLSATLCRAWQERRPAEPGEWKRWGAELAQLCQKLGDNDGAECIWRDLLREDPRFARARAAIETLLDSAGRYQELYEFLKEMLAHDVELAARLQLLARLASLAEQRLSDVLGAMHWYREMAASGHKEANRALERLLLSQGRFAELADLLSDEQARMVGAPALELLYRRARLFQEKLQQPTVAVELGAKILAEDPCHSGARDLLAEQIPQNGRAMDVLEDIYEREGSWGELGRILGFRVEQARGTDDVSAHVSLAELSEKRLGDEGAALSLWSEVLAREPKHEAALLAVARLGNSLGKPEVVAERLEAAANAAGLAVERKKVILWDLARLYEYTLGERERAVGIYETLAGEFSDDRDTVVPAAVALCRLFAELEQWQKLGDRLQQRAELSDTDIQRVKLHAECARLYEDKMDSRERAITAWKQVLVLEPSHHEALAALERLYDQAGQGRELLEILRLRLPLVRTATERKGYRARMAELATSLGAAPAEPIELWQAVLEENPHDDDALLALTGLYRQTGKSGALVGVLDQRRALLAQNDPDVADLLCETADLLRNELERDAEALDRYVGVLHLDGEHSRAIAGVKELVETPALFDDAADVLVRVYERKDEFEPLAILLERQAEHAGDAHRRAELLRRAAEIWEARVGNSHRAMAAYTACVQSGAESEEIGAAMDQLVRVAIESKRRKELIPIFNNLLAKLSQPDLLRHAQFVVADTARALGDDKIAESNYETILNTDPSDDRALQSLEDMFRARRDAPALYRLLERRASLAADGAARSVFLAKMAHLSTQALNDSQQALALWNECLDLDANHAEAQAALEDIYENRGDWPALIRLLARKLERAEHNDAIVNVRVRLGGIYADKLKDIPNAIEQYAEALGLDPIQPEAVRALLEWLPDPEHRVEAARALAAAYVITQSWASLVRVNRILLSDKTLSHSDRRRLVRRIAELHEDQLDDLQGAFEWYQKVFEDDPDDRTVWTTLERLANVLNGWEALGNTYTKALEGAPADRRQALSRALAEIWDRLDRVEPARDSYLRLLEEDPNDSESFDRLIQLLNRHERREDLAAAYDTVARQSSDPQRRLELYMTAARVRKRVPELAAGAIASYRQAIKLDHGHRAAWEGLDEIFQRDQMWTELAALLAERIGDAYEDYQRRELRLRLAQLNEQRLQDQGAAIDQYEKMLEEEAEEPLAVSNLERLVVNEPVRERIVNILEPVYRAQDHWRKLVVILDARLAYIDDKSTRVSTLIEIAKLHETRGGDPFLAFSAWARAWQTEPSDDETYQALVALGIKLEHYEALAEALEAGLVAAPDGPLVTDVLARIADVQERKLANATAAIDAWNRLRKLEPDDERALPALDRLLDAIGDKPALAEVLERRARLTSDADAAQTLWKRLGLLEVELEHPDQAIAALSEAHNLFSADAEVLGLLHRLYEQKEQWGDLAGILRGQVEMEVDPDTLSGLRRKLAGIYRRHLDEPLEAITTLRALLEEQPSDLSALEEICDIYAVTGMWSEHAETLDRRAELDTDRRRAADLSQRAAEVTHRELGDATAAIERLERLIDRHPDHEGARAYLRQFLDADETLEAAAKILENVYRAEKKFDDVAALYERRLAASSLDSHARLADLSALAEVHERGRGDIRAAFAVWVRALSESGDGEEVRTQLERIAPAASLFAELAQVYRARLEEGLESEVRARYLIRLGEILDQALEDPEAARKALAQAVDLITDPRPVLSQLVTLSERLGHYQEAVDWVERQARVENEPSERVKLLYRASELYENQLNKPTEALNLYREIVELEPAHLSTRAALSRLLAAPGLSLAVIEVLEPLCEAEGNAEGLVAIGERKLELEKHPDERARLFRRQIELLDKQPEEALGVSSRWFREMPDSEAARSTMFHLCEMTRRWPQIATLLEEVLHEASDARIRHRLLLDLGDVRVLHLGDLDAAHKDFEEAARLEPGDMTALAALEDIERRRGSYDGLLAILLRRAGADTDTDVRRAAHAERARMQRDNGDFRGAEASWKAVLDIHSDDREAGEELSTLYRRLEAWPALVDVLGTRAAHSKDAAEERQLRTEMARIYSGLLRDEDAALDAWRSILEIDPGAEDALSSLEEAYTARAAWPDARDILQLRLERALPQHRIDILIRLAWVLDEKLSDTGEAIDVLYKALELDPGHAAVIGSLDRLLAQTERYRELAEFLEDIAARAAKTDPRTATRYWVRAAEIKSEKLDDTTGAEALLSRVLELHPNDVGALLRQAQMLERQGEWDRAAKNLERALLGRPTGRDGANLYVRLAVVARHRGDDDATVRAHFSKALELDPGHPDAIAELESFAREARDWSTVADMLARRAQALGPHPDRILLARELAEISIERFQQPAWAVTYLDDALGYHPGEESLIGPLCDALEKSGDKARAAELLTKMAEAAHGKRQFRVCAGYRRRLGVLYLEMGDEAAARDHLEAAFRLDPTDVGVMIALGGVLMRKSEWEAARKVYRSLILQELGPSAGMTKADVYLALGRTHAALGEPDKAGAMYRRGLDTDKNHIGLKTALEDLAKGQ